MTQSELGNKGFVQLIFPGHRPSLREAGQELGEGMKQSLWRSTASWPLFSCSPGLVQSAFFTAQDHLPKGGTTHRGLGPRTSITNPENPHRLAYRPSVGGIFSTEVPLPKRLGSSQNPSFPPSKRRKICSFPGFLAALSTQLV